ncbi:MAG: inositol monophosphatase [Thermoplasmata archaeon]|nr:MAG: inositol monophosphatase [Thermoplasmata archaeon]
MKLMKALLHAIADTVEETVNGLVKETDLGEDLGLGADGTPTKLIDDAAEQVCIRVLEEKGGNLNILSEEAGFIDNGSKRTLVIDPIDGTHNAVRGIPFYSLSLAVGYSKLSDVEYGLVRNLVTGDTYWAERGKGAYLNEGQIRTRPLPSEDTMFSVYIGRRATKEAMQVAKMPRRGRALGCASLEMCLVATGAFDVYFLNYFPSNYSMRIVDIAASTLILREAGGEVFNDTYDILDMAFDIKERTNVIAVGDRSALEYLSNLDVEEMLA